MPGATSSAAIAELADQGRPLIVLTAGLTEAHTLERELPLFLSVDTPVLTLPDWETLPYDHFSPHQDIVSQRLRTLYELPKLTHGIVLLPITTAMLRTPPQHYIDGNTLDLKVGDTFDPEAFAKTLTLNGYRSVETVFEHGEMAIRGALLDVFPMGSAVPFRIDLLDDEVETLRTFDPESQRTVERVSEIKLMPAREFPIGGDATHRFQMAWYDTFDGDADLCPTFTEIRRAACPVAPNTTYPSFSMSVVPFLTIFPGTPRWLPWATTTMQLSATGQTLQIATKNTVSTRRRPLLPPSRGFFPVEDLYAQLGRYAVLELKHDAQSPAHVTTSFKPAPVMTDTDSGGYQDKLKRFLSDHQGPVLLCAESQGRREILLEHLAKAELSPEPVANWGEFLQSGCDFAITVAPIDRGLYAGPAPQLSSAKHNCLVSGWRSAGAGKNARDRHRRHH